MKTTIMILALFVSSILAIAANVDDAIGTPIGITGDVLVIDISNETSKGIYPIGEYLDVDMGTFNCDTYKTTKIVLRKIPAGSYYCQPGAGTYETISQKVTTKGFYIGVFPVTQRQYELVMGTNPSKFTTDSNGNIAAHRPAELLSWNTIRGSVAAGDEITSSSSDSFMRRLVVKTGLAGFDLPTEAQWEISCRAGSPSGYGAYWDGTSPIELTSSNLGAVAWYNANSSSITHAVGGKYPNLWGLYDMLGNVREWCRDIYTEHFSTEYVDVPCTNTTYDSGNYRLLRGGGWYYSSVYSHPSHRVDAYRASYSTSYAGIGFRLAGTIMTKIFPSRQSFHQRAAQSSILPLR